MEPVSWDSDATAVDPVSGDLHIEFARASKYLESNGVRLLTLTPDSELAGAQRVELADVF